jgi:hypothetical protein
MYVLLAFAEEVIVTPQGMGGSMVYLREEPQIVESLPPDTVANKTINEQLIADDVHISYEYYLNCRTTSLTIVQKALELFKIRYSDKAPNELCIDTENPIIFKLKKDLKTAKQLHSSKSIFVSYAESKSKDEDLTTTIASKLIP